MITHIIFRGFNASCLQLHVLFDKQTKLKTVGKADAKHRQGPYRSTYTDNTTLTEKIILIGLDDWHQQISSFQHTCMAKFPLSMIRKKRSIWVKIYLVFTKVKVYPHFYTSTPNINKKREKKPCYSTFIQIEKKIVMYTLHSINSFEMQSCSFKDN